MSFITTNIKFKDSNLIDIKAEETFVGWYLGKKLYRKVVEYNGPITEQYTYINHGISNFEKCIYANVITYYGYYLIPFFDGASQTYLYQCNNNQIILRMENSGWENSKWEFILYYTKTE